MRQKTILVVFWNLGIGGVQRKIVDLSHLLTEKEYHRYRLTILLRDAPHFRMDGLINQNTADIRYAPTSPYKPINLLLFFFAILYYAWRLKPATILTFLDTASLFCILISKLLFWRTIRVVCNEDTYPSFHITHPLKKFIVRLFYPHANCIIVPTHAAAGDLVKRFNMPPSIISVVPNWTLAKASQRQSFPRYDLLYAGRFDKQKDVLFLLEGVVYLRKRIPACSVLLIGEGTETVPVKTYICMHQLQSIVTIKPTTQKIHSWMENARVFVLTSRYEGMPVALLEAMTLKRPSIVRRIPGVDEYVSDGKTGFIVNTPEEFAQKAVLLLTNNHLQRSMGRKAYQEVQLRFGRKTAKQFLDTVLPA